MKNVIAFPGQAPEVRTGPCTNLPALELRAASVDTIVRMRVFESMARDFGIEVPELPEPPSGAELAEHIDQCATSVLAGTDDLDRRAADWLDEFERLIAEDEEVRLSSGRLTLTAPRRGCAPAKPRWAALPGASRGDYREGPRNRARSAGEQGRR